MKTKHDDRRNPLWLAKIALANVKEGDCLTFPAGFLRVKDVTEDRVVFMLTKNDGELIPITLTKDEVEEHNVTQSFAAIIESVGPDFESDITPIIERDPVIYRLRTKEGWIANDKLCLLTGNTQYTSIPTNKAEPDDNDAESTSSSVSSDAYQQSSFNF
ncbi:hypothetical protein [Alteromonas sp. 14N.309.X.WAT.G.H12]|uniref:hypothetical protein n=1 Tax=Alteromonas sp. 14N.309.X.WAT.G.H12 TaxID=3120824 RepID=UPI002FD75A66